MPGSPDAQTSSRAHLAVAAETEAAPDKQVGQCRGRGGGGAAAGAGPGPVGRRRELQASETCPSGLRGRKSQERIAPQ